jgi:hypothetical protein
VGEGRQRANEGGLQRYDVLEDGIVGIDVVPVHRERAERAFKGGIRVDNGARVSCGSGGE